MEIAEFQKLSVRTLNNKLTMDEQLANMVIGATGEFCGEVADNIKKYLYQGHSLDKEHIAEELGDTMFYICNLATLLDINMEDVLEKNIEKLNKRYKNGFSCKASIDRIDTK